MGVIEISTILLILLKIIGWIDASWALVFAPASFAFSYGFCVGFKKRFIIAFNKARNKVNNDGQQPAN